MAKDKSPTATLPIVPPPTAPPPPRISPPSGNDKPPAEPRDAKFRRLANRRVNRALKMLAQIGNLASRQSYEYTDEQAAKIVAALQDAVTAVKQRFSNMPRQSNLWNVGG